MKLELFDDDGNYIPNPSEPRPIEVEPMSDLISREELLKQIETDSKGHEGEYGDEWLFIDTINSIPTAEPKVGKWEECKVVDIEDTTITEIQSAYCPICHKYHTTPYMYYFDYFNYCPNCGAKMKGE